MERINVRVDPRLRERLDTKAKAKGVKPSVIVRRALEEHLRRQTPSESCFDVARRAGLLGVFRGGPADLSTTPDHMDGFGRA